MSARAHFWETELYRTVYKRGIDEGEPDWEYLNEHYAGKLCYTFYGYHVELVQPYSSMMCQVVRHVDEVIAAKGWPRDVSSDDPLEVFDDITAGCD
jgi:CO dehydrogenase/acetyl-CoA synthase beta subunit